MNSLGIKRKQELPLLNRKFMETGHFYKQLPIALNDGFIV